MTARTVLADVLLGLAVLVVLGSSLGVLLMRDVYNKLHYVTPAAVVAPVLAGLAVLAQSGFDVNTGQTWLTLVFLIGAAPFLSHATIRAIKIRQDGDWRDGDSRDGR
ncbi:MAG TPA: monovalent cation/H(+) antiporter subunit G [Streptosporangiaceae bacterium]